MKMLVVEDNVAFSQTFTEALRKLFPYMFVEEASDGIEAMDRLETFMPDLIFMDIRLPGETGLELTRKIKARHPEILIVILTDHNLPEYRTVAFEKGADDFVVKGSLNPAALERLIRSYLFRKEETMGKQNSTCS